MNVRLALNLATLLIAAQQVLAQPVQDPVADLRRSVLAGAHGTMPAQQLVGATIEAQGGGLEQVYLGLAVRKQETVPLVLEKLRTGTPYEKRMMTKIARYLGWPELVPQLIVIVSSDSEHPLSRTGALFALGAIGDASAGPAIIAVLDNANRGSTEKRVAIATLARIGVRSAVPKIRPFVHHTDAFMSIFAVRALAELGDAPTVEDLGTALTNDDYLVRREACAALGSIGNADAITKLMDIKTRDSHASVRNEARLGLTRIEIRGINQPGRTALLQKLLRDESKQIQYWALAELISDSSDTGREALQQLTKEQSPSSQKCRVRLLLASGAGPNFRGAY